MRFIITLALLVSFVNGAAQIFSGSLSYNYIYSSQLDKAIQTYNLSRPHLENKQPLFIHGINTSASYTFKSDKRFKQGIELSYSYFKSSAENEDVVNRYNLHLLNIGYLLHFQNEEKLKGFYADIIISAASSGLFRKINGEPFMIADTRSMAFGIGGNLSLRAGYSFRLNNSIFLSPFILASYSPYVYTYYNEAVINQTIGLVGKDWTAILNAQIGLMLHIKNRRG